MTCVSGPSVLEKTGAGGGRSAVAARGVARSAAPRTARDGGATEAGVSRKGGLFRLRAHAITSAGRNVGLPPPYPAAARAQSSVRALGSRSSSRATCGQCRRARDRPQDAREAAGRSAEDAIAFGRRFAESARKSAAMGGIDRWPQIRRTPGSRAWMVAATSASA